MTGEGRQTSGDGRRMNSDGRPVTNGVTGEEWGATDDGRQMLNIQVYNKMFLDGNPRF